MGIKTWLILALQAATTISAEQVPWYLGATPVGHGSNLVDPNQHHVFERPIKHVAVVGAGPHGLQFTAKLREEGLSVRLFERNTEPGGNWNFEPHRLANVEAFPQPPPSRAAYFPDIPEGFKDYDVLVRVYEEGEDGLSVEQRLAEHAPPSSVWDSLHTNSAADITRFIDLPNPAGTPWELSQYQIHRHVRGYASLHGLNSNDHLLNVTSYSTRVERAEKKKDKWVLTLRKLERIPRTRQVEVTWWTEEFDTLVISAGLSAGPVVPNVPGLKDWATRFPDLVYHSRRYRRPRAASRNGTILIVGAGISGCEIARDLSNHAKRILASVKDHPADPDMPQKTLARARLPANSQIISEIALFELDKAADGIKSGKVHLTNGTVLTGIDEVILASGYVHSFPFVSQFHNDTIQGTDEPDTEITPLVTGNGKLRNLYLAAFHMDDPTLVVAASRVWNVGSFSSTAVARVWAGRARLPNRKERIREYRELVASVKGNINSPGLQGIGFGTPLTEYLLRRLIAWINGEALIFGGKQLDNYPREWREQWIHFSKVHWGPTFPLTLQDFIDAEQLSHLGLLKREMIDHIVEQMNDY